MLERWSSIPESGDEEEDEDEDDGAECGDERGDEEANVNDADYSGDEDNEDYSGDEDNEEDASGGYSGYVEKYVNKASIGSGKRKASEYEEGYYSKISFTLYIIFLFQFYKTQSEEGKGTMEKPIRKSAVVGTM